jgi:hypothetical protein
MSHALTCAEGHDSAFRTIVDPGHVVAMGAVAVRLPSHHKPVVKQGEKCWLCGKWREVGEQATMLACLCLSCSPLPASCVSCFGTLLALVTCQVSVDGQTLAWACFVPASNPVRLCCVDSLFALVPRINSMGIDNH